MLDLLYKYLVLNKTVGIPGIGNFSCVTEHASLENGRIMPPRHTISFSPGSSLTDRVFYRFLALEKGISEVDAVRQFQDFAYQLRSSANNHPYVELAAVGILRKNQVGELSFEPRADVNSYFSPLTLQELTRKPNDAPAIAADDTAAEVYEDGADPAADRWWVWALVLTAAGLFAIVYYLMSEGII